MPSDRPVVLIERVRLERASVTAVISIADARFMRTSARPDLVERALSMVPGLEKHRCECGVPHGIRAELADTETAHLVEHLALEFMVLAGSPRTLAGETRWDAGRDCPGVFRVRVDFDDEAVALGALALATRTASALVTGGETPALEAEVDRLKTLRSSSQG